MGTPRDQNALTWTDNATTEAGFIIERSTDAGMVFAEIGRTGPDTSRFIDNRVVAGRAYTYRVRAFNAGGVSKPSNEVSYRKFAPFCSDEVTGQAQNLNDVCMLDAQRGFAVGVPVRTQKRLTGAGPGSPFGYRFLSTRTFAKSTS